MQCCFYAWQHCFLLSSSQAGIKPDLKLSDQGVVGATPFPLMGK